GGVVPLERQVLVEVLEGEPAEHRLERVTGLADVHDDAVRVQLAAPELHVHHVGGAVKPLRGTEDLSPEAVRDHEMVSNADAVHVSPIDSGRYDRSRRRAYA